MTETPIDRGPRLDGQQRALYNAVVSRVSELQRKSTDEVIRYPDVAGRLARLRRAIKAQPGSVPAVWEDTIGSLPSELWGVDGPSSWERAAHTAITLFALHAQSSTTAVHRRGISLGRAARRLAGERSGEDATDSPVFKRFQALATASTSEAMTYHLRSMITLMRGARTVQLDYGQLAVDIHDLANDRTADRVRLRWGRDYHRFRPDGDDTTVNHAESN